MAPMLALLETAQSYHDPKVSYAFSLLRVSTRVVNELTNPIRNKGYCFVDVYDHNTSAAGVMYLKINNYVSGLNGRINDMISMAMNKEVFEGDDVGCKTDEDVDVWKTKFQTWIESYAEVSYLSLQLTCNHYVPHAILII
jgi:hypothetical protein